MEGYGPCGTVCIKLPDVQNNPVCCVNGYIITVCFNTINIKFGRAVALGREGEIENHKVHGLTLPVMIYLLLRGPDICEDVET